MAIDLLFNLILFVFFGFCLINISSVSNLPGSDVMGAALWPQIILTTLLFAFALNIMKIYTSGKKDPGNAPVLNGTMVKEFVAGKLFAGIVLVALMSFLLEPLGFIITTFLFLSAYGFLLGRKCIWKQLLISFIATFMLFFIFSKGLSIMLPRGSGAIRQFSLMLENI